MTKIIIAIIVLITLFIAGCSNVNQKVVETNNNGEEIIEEKEYTKETDYTTNKETIKVLEWADTELKDVLSGESFKISDFKDDVVLIESFAVWCPTCRRQQQEVKKLHLELPEVVSVSLDIDPNEDENAVKKHAESNEFDWRFAVSPVELTQALVNEFGVTVVNAPRAPVIMICGGEARLLKQTGVKNVEDLKKEIEAGC